jgi:hypothetical protein
MFGVQTGLKSRIGPPGIQETTSASGYSGHSSSNSRTPVKAVERQQICSRDRESHLRQAEHEAYPAPHPAMLT